MCRTWWHWRQPMRPSPISALQSRQTRRCEPCVAYRRSGHGGRHFSGRCPRRHPPACRRHSAEELLRRKWQRHCRRDRPDRACRRLGRHPERQRRRSQALRQALARPDATRRRWHVASGPRQLRPPEPCAGRNAQYRPCETLTHPACTIGPIRLGCWERKDTPMPRAVPIRSDIPAVELRRRAKIETDGCASRRMLAPMAIWGVGTRGASREDAARQAGMDRQSLRAGRGLLAASPAALGAKASWPLPGSPLQLGRHRGPARSAVH